MLLGKLIFFKYCRRILALMLFCMPLTADAFSVLTHEALIDASWDKGIEPLLKFKYPLATADELKKARAFAYGGCLIADMGYFPFGSEYYTDLSHYVRSGDFVVSMLAEAENLNEYAFALGSLCHYLGDKYGHSLATNVTVPIVYPEMGKKFGKIVTYDDDHISHSRVEISFDVLQIARGNYAADNYHDDIGFEVARPVLERAFLKTYGQDINTVFGDLTLAIGSYRWSVKTLMPTVTRLAWALKKNDIKKLNPSINSHKFHYKMSKKEFNREYGSERQKPGLRASLRAILLLILPKVGPFKSLRFKAVGPQGEKLFIASFDSVVMHYRYDLNLLRHDKITLPDIDYDTGMPTRFEEYRLADKTYAELLNKLADTKFNNLTWPLKRNILHFYESADTAMIAQKHPDDWKKTYTQLQLLKNAKPIIMDSLKSAKGIYYKFNEPNP